MLCVCVLYYLTFHVTSLVLQAMQKFPVLKNVIYRAKSGEN